MLRERGVEEEGGMTYTIEGEWSGYNSGQRRVVHREHTSSKKFAGEVNCLGCIVYTDGTRLELTVSQGKHGKPMDGYRSLIRKCLAQGTQYVAELKQ